ncbi:TetR/AcrR family transcriptional regulator [Natrinema versiforme]|uniref:TetR family transcriptional regulator n=1 Tax=Natrinema versiforme JCM 10478 TaxID=1227496 RepID=L9XUR6_9EURY|nr:TetR/AcrR family transcriptional regulator [Natrinema versiforme]ELY65544.1 TetR family transcriptional regulator [Natrinema versiforme JCM 10478]
MDAPDPFQSAPDETHTEIMHATYAALRKHGYADLTIQRIGAEFPKSKSLIYQHYDGKDELLVAFLEFLLERLEADVPTDGFSDAREHLQELLDHSLPESPESDHTEFMSTVTELRAQAAHDDAYREQFTRTDDFFREHIADIVRRGIEQGVFRDVNPEQTAAFIATTIYGAQNQRATTNSDDPILAARRELEEYVRIRLSAAESET